MKTTKQVIDFTEWRRNGIGSSDAPPIMNASPWMDRKTLFGIKTGIIIPEPPNFAMYRGLELEPKARQAYEKETGILMPPDRLKLESTPFIRANFDGINRHAKRVLEIKCPGKADHYLASQGKIPDKYFWQCVHLLLVSGFKHLDYYSYNPAFGGGIIVPFTRNIRAEKRLVEEETLFWDHIRKNIQPSHELLDEPKEKKSIFPLKKRPAGKVPRAATLLIASLNKR